MNQVLDQNTGLDRSILVLIQGKVAGPRLSSVPELHSRQWFEFHANLASLYQSPSAFRYDAHCRMLTR